jgi:hypothetical protein
MKKLALTNLMLLTAIKSVSAFSEAIDKNIAEAYQERFFYQGIYFFTLVFLTVGNFSLYFVRKQKDYLFLAVLITTVFGMILVTDGAQFATDRSDDFTVFLKWEFILFLIFTAFHLGLWITKSRFPAVRIDKGDMISLKLE